jgi:hypothetical protein
VRLWLLLPLWLALAVGEQSIVHLCPTHAPAPASVQQEDHSAHGDHGSPAPDDAGHGDHACSCIDSCAIAAVAAIPEEPGVEAAPLVAFVAPAAAFAGGVASAHAQLRLPFPNGPPAIAG